MLICETLITEQLGALYIWSRTILKSCIQMTKLRTSSNYKPTKKISTKIFHCTISQFIWYLTHTSHRHLGPDREARTPPNDWEKDGASNVEPNVRKQMIVSDEMMAVHWERRGQRWPSMLRAPLAPQVSQTDLSCPSCTGPTHPHCFQWVSRDTIHHNTSLSVGFICRMDDFLYSVSERVHFQGFDGGNVIPVYLMGAAIQRDEMMGGRYKER